MESERYKATRELLMAQKMAGVMVDGGGRGDATDGAAHVRDCGGVEAEQRVHTPWTWSPTPTTATAAQQLLQQHPAGATANFFQGWKVSENYWIYCAGWFSVVKVIVDIDSNVFLSDEIIDIWYVETLKPLSCLLSLYQILHIKIVLAWLNLGFVEPRDFICIVKSPLVWLQFISFREWKFPPT